MIGVLFLGLKWLGLLLGAALFLRLCIPVKLDRRRCRRCAYDMTGVPGLTCPECGKKTRSEKRLRSKPVRKRQIALLLLLLLTAHGGYTGERAINHGWTAAVPSTPLILVYPRLHAILEAHINRTRQRSPGPSNQSLASYPTLGPIAAELIQAINERAEGEAFPLWDWQRSLFRSRAATMGQDGWYALFLLGGWDQMTSAQRDQLLEQSVDESIWVRQQTPDGYPLQVSLVNPTALGRFRITATPRVPSGEPTVIDYHSSEPRPKQPLPLVVSDSATGPIVIDLEYTEVESGHTWTHTLQTNATISGGIDDVLPALRGDALDQWLLRWAQPLLQMTVQNRGDEPPRLEIGLILLQYPAHTLGGPPQQPDPLPQDAIGVSLNVDLELLAGETIIGRGNTHSNAAQYSQGHLWKPVENRTAYLRLNPEAFWEAIEHATPLSVRIRSRPAAESLRALDATSRWTGELEIPLASIYATDSSIRSGNQTVAAIDLRGHSLMHLNKPLPQQPDEPNP